MRIFIIALFMVIAGCKTHKMTRRDSKDKAEIVTDYTASAHALVYKTKADYNNLVPVILSDDKSEIVSYPDPEDIKSRSGYPQPHALIHGYLLDNRGIGSNVAFINMTYREYSRLEKAPDLQELYNLILDKDPLTELYDCGIRKDFTDPAAQLNGLIEGNELLTRCKRIK